MTLILLQHNRTRVVYIPTRPGRPALSLLSWVGVPNTLRPFDLTSHAPFGVPVYRAREAVRK